MYKLDVWACWKNAAFDCNKVATVHDIYTREQLVSTVKSFIFVNGYIHDLWGKSMRR